MKGGVLLKYRGFLKGRLALFFHIDGGFAMFLGLGAVWNSSGSGGSPSFNPAVAFCPVLQYGPYTQFQITKTMFISAGLDVYHMFSIDKRKRSFWTYLRPGIKFGFRA
jgi:hypothetical protein